MKSHPDDIEFEDEFTALDSLSELRSPASRVASSSSTAAPSSKRDKQLQMLAVQMATAVQMVKKPEVTPENKIMDIVEQFKGAMVAAKKDCNSTSTGKACPKNKSNKLEERVLPDHVSWIYIYIQPLLCLLREMFVNVYAMLQPLGTYFNTPSTLHMHLEQSCGLRFSTP